MKRKPGEWATVRHRLPDDTPLYSLDLLQLRATLEAAKTEIGKRGGSVGVLAFITIALEKL